MKTLNKTLSLILALAMVFGLMGVASAAFTDQSKITHTTAVNTCVALNIINGYSDGSYAPAGLVTRAELCKMICIAYNGGVTPTLATTTNPTYTDTANNWASAYIEYCTKLGIVSGTGNGMFDPDGTVTGTQAAKMMLVALGYSAKNEGFTGTNWDVAVNVRANEKKLYNELVSFDPGTGLNRDNAAQMIYNMLQATEVEYNYNISTDANGKVITTAVLKDKYVGNTSTKLEFETDKYGLKSALGVFGSESYNSTSKTYKFSTASTYSGDNDAMVFTSSTDYSQYYNMHVKVLYKVDSNNNNVVYGVVPVNSTVVGTGIFGSIAAKYAAGVRSLQFTDDNGTTYKFSSATAMGYVYDFNTSAARALNSSTDIQYTYEFIDNTGDGKIDSVVLYPFTVQKVTALTSTTISSKYAAAFQTAATAGTIPAAYAAKTLDDLDTYTGIAKGDYVKVTPSAFTVTGKDKLEKIPALSGTVSKTKTENNIPKVYVKEVSQWLVNATGDSSYGIGTYTGVVQVNGFIYAATQASSVTSSAQYALLTWAGPYQDGYSAKLLFSDGTTKTVTTDSTSAGRYTAHTPVLVNYTVSSSTGAYTLTPAADGPYNGHITAGTDTYTYNPNGSTIGSTNTYKIADDAVVFAYINDTTKASKVITGAQLKALASASVSIVNNGFYTTASTGYSTINLAYVTLTNYTSGDTKYGYVTAADSALNSDNTTVTELTFWDGSNHADVLTDQLYSGSSAFAAGDLISYTTNSDGSITPTKLSKNLGAITALDGTSIQIGSGTTAKTTTSVYTSYNSKSTVIFTIDSANKKGVEGTDLQTADYTTSGTTKTYTNNVYYIDGGSTTLPFTLIVIDSNNVMQ